MENRTFKISGTWYENRKTFPSLNDYISEIGKHPKAGGRFKDKYMKVAMSSIRRDLRGWKPKGKVIIDYAFFEPIKGQKRDVMNIFSFADKIIEDALQKTGTLKGDDPRYVVNTTHEFHYTDKEPYILVRVREVENGLDD